MPAFDIINNTKYEINDWKQLVGLTSNLSQDVKIAVNWNILCKNNMIIYEKLQNIDCIMIKNK